MTVEIWPKFYTFERERTGVTHAVMTRWRPMNFYYLDRHFGGDFIQVCTEKVGSGKGILSEKTTNRKSKVTCVLCLSKMS